MSTMGPFLRPGGPSPWLCGKHAVLALISEMESEAGTQESQGGDTGDKTA